MFAMTPSRANRGMSWGSTTSRCAIWWRPSCLGVADGEFERVEAFAYRAVADGVHVYPEPLAGQQCGDPVQLGGVE